jgi:hypothetical protein
MMKNKTLFVILFTVLLVRGNLGAQTFPSLEADPKAFELAARLSRNSTTAASGYWRDLAEAALWASSVNAGPAAEANAAAYLDRINAAAAELASAPDLPANPRERGEYILTFMYRRFLKSYSEQQTRVDEIFKSGRYNCFSSASLYVILSLSTGLNAGAVMTKDHAFATINTGSEIIDVETTNAYGFDPGNRKEFHDGFGKSTGFAYVPAKNYRDRAVINSLELISLILSNRITVFEKSNRFGEAVPLGINRAALLSQNRAAVQEGAEGKEARAELFEDPQKDMMTRLFNYGAYLIKTGKDNDALAWADYAGQRYPDPPPSAQREGSPPAPGWQNFINAAMNNMLVRLIRTNKSAGARAALNAGKHRLNDESYITFDTMVLEAEMAAEVNAIKNPGEAEAALTHLAGIWERLPEKSRDEMRTGAILKEAERLGKGKDWTGALAWTSTESSRYGLEQNNRIVNAMKIFRQNRVNALHNEFAALYNKKDYNGAMAAALKALEEFPNEKQMIQDRTIVERALKAASPPPGKE